MSLNKELKEWSLSLFFFVKEWATSFLLFVFPRSDQVLLRSEQRFFIFKGVINEFFVKEWSLIFFQGVINEFFC